MQSSRKGRVARGVAAASIATFVALGFHVTAGGAMPGPLGVAVPWVLSVMVCTLLAGRKLSLLRLSLAVTLSQILFHVLFVVGMIDPVFSSGHVHGSGHMHLHGSPLVIEGSAELGADPLMVLSHLAAAAVTVAVIHHAESLLTALQRLAAQVVHWTRALLTPPQPPVDRQTIRLTLLSNLIAIPREAVARMPLRRGPPVLL